MQKKNKKIEIAKKKKKKNKVDWLWMFEWTYEGCFLVDY